VSNGRARRTVSSQAHWLRPVGYVVLAALPLTLLLAQDGGGVRGLPPVPPRSQPRDEALAADAVRQLIEADWLKQAEAWDPAKAAAGRGRARQPRGDAAARATATWQDAAGAVDGVKNGRHAFHTAQEPSPWWQVDLGKAAEIARIVVYNRLDYAPGLHNADNLNVLASDDGKAWKLVHENRRHFGGVRPPGPLEVKFDLAPLKARYVRLQIPGDKPIFLHLDEVELYAAGDAKKNIALGCRADQSSLSQWSVAKGGAAQQSRGVSPPTPPTTTAFPIAEFIDRGRKLAAELAGTGVDTAAAVRELDAAAGELGAVKGDAAQALYLKVRWAVRRLAFANPLLRFDKLLFMKRFTQETYPDVCLNHMPWVSRPGGDICVLRNPFSPDGSGQSVRHLLNGALGPGHVHGMDLWWDGSRIVFGCARSKTGQPPPGFPGRLGHDVRLMVEPIHIYEVNVDGSALRQLTDHEMWSDLDPTYLPNGNICFVSDRCGYSLQCNEMNKDETSTNLYVIKPDGSGMRRLSVTKDGDYLPHTLDDGQVAYTRWEYQERGWAPIQSIWTIRPDGTWADALFKQHMNAPWALEETRSIPGSGRLVAVASGHHTLPIGPVCIIDPHVGMNDPAGIAIVTPGARNPEGPMAGAPVPDGGVRDAGGFYSHPWALSEKFFLCCYSYSGRQTEAAGFGVYYIDVFGNKELIFRDPEISSFEPIPLRPRPRPPVLPEMIDLKKDYAVCSVSRVSDGVDGVAPADIRYIRVSQRLAWPYDKPHGGMRYETDAKGRGLNWTPARVIGTVPLGADGKALFRVPVDQPVYFQLLDANQMELRRMRSFISFQPGEVRACVGCHESRAVAGLVVEPEQFGRPKVPVDPTPPPWGSGAMNFLRDVQPVLDRHCIRCHSGLKPAGGLDLFGGLTAEHNVAYDGIVRRRLVSVCNKNSNADITQPLQFGSHRSRIVEVLRGQEHAKRAQLSGEDWLRLVTWIDLNAPYHDRFINKRPAVQPYNLGGDRGLAGQLAAAQGQRCAGCHKPQEVLRTDWIDVRDPARSLFLLAPLAKTAGGWDKCRKAVGGIPAGQAVYAEKSEADYQAVLKVVTSAVKRAADQPRRDMEWLSAPARPDWKPAAPAASTGLRSH